MRKTTGVLTIGLLAIAVPALAGWHTVNNFYSLGGSSNVTQMLQDVRGDMWFMTLHQGVSRHNGASLQRYFNVDGAPGGDGRMIADPTGTLWFYGGSVSGVIRYDGYWASFYRGSAVHAALVDHEGHPWFATDRGVLRYDPANPRWFRSADGLASTSVRGLVEDRSGHIWAFGDSGVSRYDSTRWTAYHASDAPGLDAVTSTLRTASGLWFMSDHFVIRYDGSRWTAFSDALIGHPDQFLLEDRAGHVWVQTDGGRVFRYDGAWADLTPPDGLANGRRLMLQASSDTLWVTGIDLCRFDGTSWQVLPAPFSAGRNRPALDPHFIGALEDRSGNLWFASDSGFGAIRYRHGRWQVFDLGTASISNDLTSMMLDKSGNVWVGSTDGGLSRYDGTDWYTPTDESRAPIQAAGSTLEDSAGDLWFSSGWEPYGVRRYDGATWRRFSPAGGDSTVSQAVRVMLQDSRGSFWFACTSLPGVDSLAPPRPGSLSVWNQSLTTRHTFTAEELPGGDNVLSLCDDGSGVWACSEGAAEGVSRYDGTSWTTYAPEGLSHRDVKMIAADRAGNVWFLTGGSGITRFDGVRWTTFTQDSGLASNGIRNTIFLQDHAGAIWIATDHGVSRYDGTRWTNFASADGIPVKDVNGALEDRTGNLWFGGDLAVGMLDTHGQWHRYTTAEGLARNQVYSLSEDPAGGIWANHYYAASRFDGTRWIVMDSDAGVPGSSARILHIDRRGAVWLEIDSKITEYELDRVAPRVVLTKAPPRVSGTRIQSAAAFAAYSEPRVELAFRVDRVACDGSGATAVGTWSPWSLIGTWSSPDLEDGCHRLIVAARDLLGNVDTTIVPFEVDATPAAPVLALASQDRVVSGRVVLRGTAADDKFGSYSVRVRPAGSTTWDSVAVTTLAYSGSPVVSDSLATWDTASMPDGIYEVGLFVTDTLRLTGSTVVTVVVDNVAPFADQTAPARITAAEGGDIFTTNGELHLYFSPRALREDAVVSITPLAAGAPDTLSSGAIRAGSEYEIAWSGSALAKPARIEFALGAGLAGAGGWAPAVYSSVDGTNWRRLGGTLDGAGQHLQLAITDPGRYALFAESSVPNGAPSLSTLSFTPRVFSPNGRFADTQVGIGFTLGQAGPVTVRVYNRAGWMVREVASGLRLGPGANLVKWDGRDAGGAFVADGLYVVSVEAQQQKQTRTLAVVR